MDDDLYEVTWNKGDKENNKRTNFEGPNRPSVQEAAQIVAVKEDEEVTRIYIEKIQKVNR